MRKALAVYPSGVKEVIDMPDDEMAAVVVLREKLKGYLEYVPMPNGLSMFVNEEGKLLEMPFNIEATKLSGLYPHDVIAGPAVIMGPPDRNGDTLGLTPKQLSDLL